MNSRRLGNILKFRVSEMPFPGVSKRYFYRGYQVVSSEYIENTVTRKTGNNAFEMSQASHDIARFERFADLKLFKYASTGKRMLYNFIRWCLFFVSSYGRRR